MKTLIFILLKLAEIIGACIALFLLGLASYGIGFLLDDGTTGLPLLIIGGFLAICLALILLGLSTALIYHLYTDWIPNWFKANRKLTDRIYNRLKK